MTPDVAADEVERFRDLIERRMGLHLEDAKLGLLAEVLRRRLRATSQSCGSYLYQLDEKGDSVELGVLAEELTVPETYFFRNIDQFHAFVEHVVPERLRERGNAGRLQILSAGCATGEEAYTLAILLHRSLADSPSVTIRAVDINPVVLERARRGRYSSFALRETPPEMQQRWFSPDGGNVMLDHSIRAAVTFEHANLAEANPDLWRPASYDVVFCRNVIMYFAPDAARNLVERIARALVPGGYLFLGHAETLRGLSTEFQLCHTNGTFYYQRKSAERPATAPVFDSRTVSRPLETAIPDEKNPAWMSEIGLASKRVQQLTEPARSQRRVRLASGAPQDEWDLAQALGLLKQERIAEALDLVESLPSAAGGDPDVLLLQAVLLTHSGLLARAEETCRRLLVVDDLNAGAHYLLALCREGAGDLVGAADEDHVAAYLDPGFAMPRVHLGLLARRAGQVAVARRELSQAITLLQREEASRVLLFGGGFNREALIALCRAELASKRQAR